MTTRRSTALNNCGVASHFDRPTIIRPPSERRSYFLPLTSGCSNSTCTFCGYYGSKLQIRDITGVEQEIDALAQFMRHGVQLPDIPSIVYDIAHQWDKRRVFLQDGDALIYPFTKLRRALQCLDASFPELKRVAAYATPNSILLKSPDELRELRELKLGILYMGIESGDEDVLRNIRKGVDYNQMVEAGKKARQAGITLSVTVILGLAGVDGSPKHVTETARILTDIDPEYAGALTLILVPGTPLYEQAERGEFQLLSAFQSLAELKSIIENSTFTNCFFSSMHASNYIAIRGKLPVDKPKMIQELDSILAKRDPSLLRPEFMRGL